MVRSLMERINLLNVKFSGSGDKGKVREAWNMCVRKDDTS